MTKINGEPIQFRQLVIQIDKHIYDVVTAYFFNYNYLIGASVQDMIQAYNQHGQHKIDFTKIYDLQD